MFFRDEDISKYQLQAYQSALLAVLVRTVRLSAFFLENICMYQGAQLTRSSGAHSRSISYLSISMYTLADDSNVFITESSAGYGF
jgi:hypothetical protein